jgi:hypothetical protein
MIPCNDCLNTEAVACAQCNRERAARIVALEAERDQLKALLVEAFPYLKHQAEPPEALIQKIRDVFAPGFKITTKPS